MNETNNRLEEVMADTIIIAAKEDTFKSVFLGEQSWYPIRLGDEKLPVLECVAVYQTSPISAITYYAKLLDISKYGDHGRYRLVFDTPIRFEPPIVLGDMAKQAMQGQRYTMMDKLRKAKTIADLKPWD